MAERLVGPVCTGLKLIAYSLNLLLFYRKTYSHYMFKEIPQTGIAILLNYLFFDFIGY